MRAPSWSGRMKSGALVPGSSIAASIPSQRRGGGQAQKNALPARSMTYITPLCVIRQEHAETVGPEANLPGVQRLRRLLRPDSLLAYMLLAYMRESAICISSAPLVASSG